MRDGAQPLCAWRDPRHRHRGGARRCRGCSAVYTAADLEAGGIGPLPPRQVMNNRDGTPMLQPGPPCAGDRQGAVCRRAGRLRSSPRRIAAGQGRRRGGDRRHRPAAGGHRARARRPHPARRSSTTTCPGNVGLDFHYGDSEQVAAAFAAAAHVTRLELRNNRIVVNPMEPRAAIARVRRRAQHWTLHVGCQGVFGFRNYIAQVLGRRARQDARA